jgi:hypothetical protein
MHKTKSQKSGEEMKPLFTQKLLKEIQKDNAKNWEKFWQENAKNNEKKAVKK